MTDAAPPQQRPSSRSVRTIPFFAGLTLEESETVERLFVIRRYVKDQIVLLEEETCNCMYLIYSGKVRVVKRNAEGKEQIITFHRRNEFFGEMSLLDGKTAPATVIAQEDAVIGFLSREDFHRFLMNNERIMKNIVSVLCSRLRDSWEMIRILSFNNENAEQRMLTVLDRLQGMYGVKDSRGTIINVKLTHQQLADYASVTRETVSRVLKNLTKSQMIDILDNKSILLTQSFYDHIGNSG